MTTITSEVLVGYCAVDSGQIMLVDPSYAADNAFVGTSGEPFAANLRAPYPFSYNGACSATCSPEQAGQLGEGTAVVVASGYGDGFYPVYATYVEDDTWGRRIASVRIDFISDEDEDDE